MKPPEVARTVVACEARDHRIDERVADFFDRGSGRGGNSRRSAF